MVRLSTLVVLTVALVAGCSSDQRSEVPTNGGFVLDCFTDNIEYVSIDSVDGPGSTTPLAALSQMGPELFPAGSPEIESERGDRVAVLFRDEDQFRVARVFVVDNGRGWVVQGTESCES